MVQLEQMIGVVWDVGSITRPRYKIGACTMNTIVSSNSPQGKYYVYTLAYPDSMGGAVFYVGKGSGKRMHDHEIEARGYKHRTYNDPKISTIQEIWASGKEVIKTKVAYFDNELDALMYEWALINMTTYTEQLTNIVRGASWPATTPRKALPVLDVPICMTRTGSYPDRKGRVFFGKEKRVYHNITDIDDFCRKRSLNRNKAKDIVEGKIQSYGGWIIAKNCPCSALQPEQIVE